MALAVPPAPLERAGERPKNHAHVVQVAVGQQHALLLTDEGIVYSWGGSNKWGQLGRGSVQADKEREPSPITEVLRNEVIVQIACGANHCLALSQNGALFSWGFNKAGQLGIDGFNATAPESALIHKTPTVVKGFSGKDGAPKVRSCSCGPESSACVITNGEVYIWGAISYYFFGDHARYERDENCTVPVRIRGVQKLRGLKTDYCPDQIALHRRHFACTVGRTGAVDDLLNLMGVLKARSGRLSAVVRSKKQESKERGSMAAGDDLHEQEEIRLLDMEFKKQRQEYEEQIRNIEDQRRTVDSDLSRVSRELTICDQQDTALTEKAAQFEAKKTETGQGVAENVRLKTLDTQLSDINYFRLSNKKTRIQLLTERDKLEQQKLAFDRDHVYYTQEKAEVEGRSKLIRGLLRGGLAGNTRDLVDEGLEIAMNKREELAATQPEALASAERFSGLREVLSISDRALQDVSSALKEITGVTGSLEGMAIVEALEANLKLRKEHNSVVHEKLIRAEKLTNGMTSNAPGMVGFFREAAAPQPAGQSSLDVGWR